MLSGDTSVVTSGGSPLLYCLGPFMDRNSVNLEDLESEKFRLKEIEAKEFNSIRLLAKRA